MESDEGNLKTESKDKIFQIFKDFLTRIAKLEELGAVGSTLVNGFQQGLEFLRRPPINTTSELVANIIKANETKRLNSYIKAGCNNTHDIVQNMSKSKGIIDELEHLLKDLAAAVQIANGHLSPLMNDDSSGHLYQPAAADQEEMSSSDIQELKMTDHAALMGIIYSMVKQDYVMQEKIVTSLNLKSSSGELDSYCQMWSLRPFIHDEIVQQAWKLMS